MKNKTVMPTIIESKKKIEPWALDVLANLVVADDGVKIAVQLDAQNYRYIDGILKSIGGKWSSGRKAHIFPCDPKPLLASLLTLGTIPQKNPLAFFPTPKNLLHGLFTNWSQLDDDTRRIADNGGRILEPSAGTGAIVSYLLERYPDLKGRIDCVEIDPYKAQILRELGAGKVYESSFEEWQPDPGVVYAGVIMNPPFTTPKNKLAYIDHVQKAAGILHEGGLLAAIIPPGFLFNGASKTRDFRDWAAERCEMTHNGACAFEESGTGIDTVTIVGELRRDGVLWRNEPHQGYSSFHAFQCGVCMDEDDAQKVMEIVREAVRDGASNINEVMADEFVNSSLRALASGIADRLAKDGCLISLREEILKGTVADFVDRVADELDLVKIPDIEEASAVAGGSYEDEFSQLSLGFEE
jgi:hypothetical protein